ncbi:alkaline phosphatase family protein [Streptomyces griseoviridis]|jgi:predicted AlkP superfamily phosphohydrolase/phosphomutase|uniref:AlkP superfamily phosphohydrolase/phosphomutase n=3 Tax=Streptomyces TaxID=1883 RepID=A0ABT9L9M2_STRGD|nr:MULTISPECIES: alkaline phosphatase family protein [Streptomyces]MDP9680416.1 putative AlkP superfamily phosphohydrolase/phosphomutase [Streptomyces griseoviridis]GGS67072.1 phosphodiesterase [Streptomyces niveoruber]GGT16173.1 phosphodiesterase [Streptomyces griseoviridis]GGU63221.1 phosphodiesterase [Streptomyces daghestanicus]GHI29060.1 phosphodiesterase [Streptomyces daghestanicus]
MPQPGRVAVIGLDSATPQLMFDRFAEDMPVLSALRQRSLWGPMRSVDPPITMPAWSCMMSGRTPGELGVYGFRDRAAHDYGPLAFATSRSIRAPRIWDEMTAEGRDSVVLGVPGTYPPTPIRGAMVSCFLAPSTRSEFTSPPALRDDLEKLTGGYALDVENFRSPELGRVSQQIFDMSEQRFQVARHLATHQDWEFLSFVDMGPDRLHHGFWKYCDPGHPRHEPGNPYENLFRDYYRALDRHIGDFLECLPENTSVLVVSDHGAQPMVGGLFINEWLRREGLLVLAKEPAGPTPMARAHVDWKRTTAWAEGGYYGRIFLNVEGREPEGTVPAGEYDATLDRIASALERLPDDQGNPMGTRALRPEQLYPEVNGIAPDLLVYVGNLRWRALATLGMGQGLYTTENDTGPDHANHGDTGILVLDTPGIAPGRAEDLSLYDVAPALRELLGLPGGGRLPG